ncbi:hypothetical protein QCA50_001109 [Cerrena zonata]|uniref:Uncharacterized protein n=1 Tax=Cerrena zonata TaxID=2478898 RepID=A0AAW0GW14_9APHY
MPAWVVVTPPVMPHPDCKPSLSQTVSTKHTKVWRHLEHISEIQDEDDEDEDMPIHLEPPLINPYEALSSFSHFIVQPKATLSADTALSGPVILPSRGGQPPNVPHPEPTMGYGVFKKKYTELQIAGLLDGSGIWVQDEAENYLDPEP